MTAHLIQDVPDYRVWPWLFPFIPGCGSTLKVSLDNQVRVGKVVSVNYDLVEHNVQIRVVFNK